MVADGKEKDGSIHLSVTNASYSRIRSCCFWLKGLILASEIVLILGYVETNSHADLYVPFSVSLISCLLGWLRTRN